MKSILAVSILVLTVFLSSSVSAYGGMYPYPICGYVTSSDGIPDGADVTIYKYGDPSNNTTVKVSSGPSGFWKAGLCNIPGVTAINNGEVFIVKVADGNFIGDGRLVINTSMGGQQVEDITLKAAPLGDTPDDGTTGGSGEGTYPPGWGETPTPAPTPDATATPAPTEAKPPVTPPAEEEAATPVAEGEATAEETEPPGELKTPGFGAVFMIAGMLTAVYLVLRRRE